MKELTINGITLQYEKKYEDYTNSFSTNFYIGTEEITERKYVFFGSKITKIFPKFAFNIYADYDNLRLTKDWWKAEILRELELLNRKEQLSKGKLI